MRAILVLLLSIAPAFAHDHAHPELNDWMAGLHNENGVPCCDGLDAKRVNDVDWDTSCDKEGCHYRVRLDGKWLDVPDSQVIRGPNRAGYPFVTLHQGLINCFAPGGGT